MEKYRFYWEKTDESGIVSKGNFTVTAQSYEECMKIAEEEIKKSGAVLDDWHVC